MKTKLILIAVIALLGFTMLFAFKPSEGSKKYLTLTTFDKDIGAALYIVDENGNFQEKKVKSIYKEEGAKDLNIELNSISARGYKLVNSAPFNRSSFYGMLFIFEKE